MSSQYTDITILLDRSGSMESIKDAMESALDEFLLAHRKVPTTRVSLIQFDGIDPQEEVYLDRPVADAPHTVIVPRDMTPLCDALCQAIDRAGSRLQQKAESLRPDQVLFIVVTDGLENASHTHNRADVTSRVKHQTDNYQWQFIYLGANQDAIGEAAKLGIQADHAIAYTAGDNGTGNVMSAVAANSVSYAQQATRGRVTTLAFNAMQRSSAMAPDEDESFEHLKTTPGETQLPLPLVPSTPEPPK